MASEDSSFNATGPATVAFETITDQQAFGVGVTGNQCGVFGGSGAGITSRPTPADVPPGTGVAGIGASTGVLGRGPTGVIGAGAVLRLAGSSVVVSGIGEQFGVQGQSVESVGVLGQGGVVGLQGIHDGQRGVPGKGAAVAAEASDSPNLQSVVGLRAWSESNRAGVFMTGAAHRRPAQLQPTDPREVVAQIHLAPIGAEQPPRHGTAGDLLAILRASRLNLTTEAELWFCTRSSQPTTTASWTRVA